MRMMRLPETTRPVAPDESPRGAFASASDLTDLFAAIAVVVPVAWLLKLLLS